MPSINFYRDGPVKTIEEWSKLGQTMEVVLPPFSGEAVLYSSALPDNEPIDLRMLSENKGHHH